MVKLTLALGGTLLAILSLGAPLQVATPVILTAAQKHVLAQAIAKGDTKQLADFVAPQLLLYIPLSSQNTDRLIVESVAFTTGRLERTNRWNYILQTVPGSPAAVIPAAIDWFKQVVTEFPDSPYAHFYLGMAYRVLGIKEGLTSKEGWDEQYGLAIQSFQSAIQRSPRFSEAYYGLADGFSLMSVGASIHNDEQSIAYRTQAVDAYKKVVELNPSNGDAWHALGDFLSSDGNYAEAMECFKKALNHSSLPDASIYFALGSTALKAGHTDQAIAYTVKAVALFKNPSTCPACYLTLGEAYEKEGDTKKAIDAYDQALRSGPYLAVNREDIKKKVEALRRDLPTNK